MSNLTEAITIRYTVVEADPEYLLTKRIWAGENGALVKQAAANPVRGVFADIANCGSADGTADNRPSYRAGCDQPDSGRYA